MKPIFLLVFLLLAFTGYSQSSEGKRPWKEGKPLVWQEFRGKPQQGSPFHANTSSGIAFSWSLKTSGEATEFHYEVGNNFYPNRSWVKGKKGSQGLLAHEQLHFDISELFARKLRLQLSLYSLGPKVKEELNEIYEQNEKGRQEMQAKYDAETNHSLVKEEQVKWEQFVKLELKKLDAFSS